MATFLFQKRSVMMTPKTVNLRRGFAVFASGFHRLAFFFFASCAGVWFYALNEWWGLWAAVVGFLPLGFISSMLPAMLIGTLRNVGVGDAVLTWAPILAGLAVAVWGIVWFERVGRAFVVLAGAGLVSVGIGMFQLRMNAMRLRAVRGELDPEDVAFLEEVDAAKRYRTEPFGS